MPPRERCARHLLSIALPQNMGLAAMRNEFIRVLGGFAIVLALFYGTLPGLQWWDAQPSSLARASRSATRAEHARLLRDALERFRSTNGSYPVLHNKPVDDLKPALVDGGYLKSIPAEPRYNDKPYRYTTDGSPDGQRFGLLFPVEGGGLCVIEVGATSTGWWNGRPRPRCHF